MSDYDYSLPSERIARYPTPERDGSRLMVLDRTAAETAVRHARFPDLIELVRPGDLMVVNDTQVFPARLRGHKPSGAAAEILLLHPLAGTPDPNGRIWEALVRPGGKLKPGREVVIGPELTVEVLDATGDGGRVVRLRTELTTDDALARYGQVPLPPYLDREAEASDSERYQTVYARTRGSVAAPTAGLHFTEGLLSTLTENGVDIASVLLHVGVGTFRPVEADDPAAHAMHAERYSVPETTRLAIRETKASGGRVWAVGTTVVRALESDALRPAVEGMTSTRLFIRPPFRFKVVDALLTNFHLPRSTLLMLVAAFGGYRRVMHAYEEAVAEHYRFYSYGDAMVIV